MKVRYGTDIETLAKSVTGFQESSDPSQDALLALAVAYRAVHRLDGMEGVDLEFGGRPLALPSIERAYREVLHIRKSIYAEWLITSLITKFGRLQGG